MDLAWTDLLIAFAVCHLAGDYLLQTDWQARRKRGGLTGGPIARRALASHVATYTAAFVPAITWLWVERGAAPAAAAVVAVALPHLAVDDGRLVDGWLRRVKRIRGAVEPGLATAVDQSLHAVSLGLAAVLLCL